MEEQVAHGEKLKDNNCPIVLSSDDDSGSEKISHESTPTTNVISNYSGTEKLRQLLCADRSESQETKSDTPRDEDRSEIPLCSYTGAANTQAVKRYKIDGNLNKLKCQPYSALQNRIYQRKGSNGKMQFACDTKLSLLQLAHKLRLTRERVAKKRYFGPKMTRIKDLLSKKQSNQQGTNPSKETECTTNKLLPSDVNKLSSPVQVKAVNSSSASAMEVTVTMKQSPIAKDAVKLLPLPIIPKKAVEFLTSLKVSSYKNGQDIAEIEEYGKHLPECSHLPLWPLFGANKESASKMQIPALNEYIEHVEGITTGPDSKANPTKVPSCGSSAGYVKSNQKVIIPDQIQCPEQLSDIELEAVEQAAVATVLSTNLPKSARKAYDMTRLSFDGYKKIINQNIIRAAAATSNSLLKGSNPGCTSVTQQANKSGVFVTNTKSSKSTVGTGLQANSPYTVSLLKMSSPHMVNLQGSVRVSLPRTTKNPNSLLLNQQKVPITVPGRTSRNNVVLLVKEVNSDINSVELVTVNSPNQSQGKGGSHEVRVQDVNVIKKDQEREPNCTIHNASHTESSAGKGLPRKFQCGQCRYQTDNRSHLRRHESSVHSGDKLYCCYVCKKEFARSEKCKSHIIKTHPEVGYDHRFIRKDKFQSRQVCQSPSMSQIKMEEDSDSPAKVSPVPFTSTPIKEYTEPADHVKMEEVTDHLANNVDEEGGEISNGSNGTNIWEQSKDHSNISNGSSQEDGAIDLSLNSNKANQLDSPTRMFKCQICFYIGRDAWHLKRHIADVHNNKKAFRCRKCNYVSSRKHRLISHMKNHGELYCIHCEFSTTDYNEFSYHLKNCTLQQKAGHMACDLCKQPCFNRKIMSDHMWRIHKTELLCCDLCHFTCSDEGRFETHEQEHFKVDCSATCNKCKVTFQNESMCSQHIIKFHKGEGEDTVFDQACVQEIDNVYRCLLCFFETEHKPVMKNHVDMHSRNRYLCEVSGCTFSCTSKKAMRSHLKSGHKETHKDSDTRKSASPAKNTKEDEDEIVDDHMEVDLASNPYKGNKDDIIYDADTGGIIGHGSGRWNCTICPDKPPFRYRRSYEKHMSKHGDFADQSSDKDIEELEKHQQMVHKMEGIDVDPVERENENWLEVTIDQNGIADECTDPGNHELEQGQLPTEEKVNAWSRRNSVQDWVNQQQQYVQKAAMDAGSEASGQED